MQGTVYRAKIKKLILVAINTKLPGLKQADKKVISELAAKLIHAKLYGAEVDNVQSPIWRDLWAQTDDSYNPTKTAEQILIEARNDK